MYMQEKKRPRQRIENNGGSSRPFTPAARRSGLSPDLPSKEKKRALGGFTLIELLVVVAIVGILAAIAIPQFASYRAQALCARVEADVRNTVTTQEAAYAANQAYNDTEKVESDGVEITVDDNDTNVDVTGSHDACTRGTFTFTGSTGQYAWSDGDS